MKTFLLTGLGFFIPFAVLWGFVLVDIQPDGMLEAQLIPGVRTPYLYSPLPDTRIRASEYENEKVYDMNGEPAYFSLRLPQTAYDRVTIGVEFMAVDQPILEIGPETKEGAQSFDLRPFFNSFLEESPWSVRKQGDVSIYEKNTKDTEYVRDEVATYAYEFPVPYRDASYTANTARRAYEVDLRGSHRIKAYVKDEALDMRFLLTDLNRDLGRDDIVIQIYDESHRLVKEILEADEGNDRADQDVTSHEIHIYERGLAEGVYEINIATTTDVFIRTIDTTLRKFVFLNRLYAGDAVGWREAPARTTYIGNGQAYTLQTLHNEGLQTVYFDRASIVLDETHTQTQFILEKPREKIYMEIPKGDVLVVSDGVFALTEDAFFMPDTRALGPFTNIESLGIDAVYTTYEPVDQLGGWMRAEQTFDAQAWFEADRRTVRFALSAPFIATQEGHVYIKRIYARFEKTPIHSVAGFIHALRERIPFGL